MIQYTIKMSHLKLPQRTYSFLLFYKMVYFVFPGDSSNIATQSKSPNIKIELQFVLKIYPSYNCMPICIATELLTIYQHIFQFFNLIQFQIPMIINQQQANSDNIQTIHNERQLLGNTDEYQQQINFQQANTFLIIDKNDRNFIILLWIGFVCLAGLGFILVGLAPQTYIKLRISSSICPNPVIINTDKSLSCADFNLKTNPKLGMVVTGLDNNNKHLKVKSNFYFKDNAKSQIVNQSIKISQYELKNDQKLQKAILSESFELFVDNQTIQNPILNNQMKLIGIQTQLLYQHQIISPNILVVVEFNNISKDANLQNVLLEIWSVDPKFSQYQICIRTAFSVISIFSSISYFISQRKIKTSAKMLKYKFVVSLSILLVLFNNPLIKALHYSDNWVLLFLLQVIYILFPTYLVFFWMSIFQKAGSENNIHCSKIHKKSFNWILTFFLFIFQLTFHLYKEYHNFTDYTGTNIQLFSQVCLKYTCFIIAIVCYGVIIVRIISLLKNKQTLLRDRRLASISILPIILSFMFTITSQFGVLVSDAKSLFLQLYFLNLYVLFLQIFYSKSKITANLPLKRLSTLISDSQINQIQQQYADTPNLMKIHFVQDAQKMEMDKFILVSRIAQKQNIERTKLRSNINKYLKINNNKSTCFHSCINSTSNFKEPLLFDNGLQRVETNKM